jgi:hypothetical protein
LLAVVRVHSAVRLRASARALAGISHAVAVAVLLAGVRHVRAVVLDVLDTVAVVVHARQVRDQLEQEGAAGDEGRPARRELRDRDEPEVAGERVAPRAVAHRGSRTDRNAVVVPARRLRREVDREVDGLLVGVGDLDRHVERHQARRELRSLRRSHLLDLDPGTEPEEDLREDDVRVGLPAVGRRGRRHPHVLLGQKALAPDDRQRARRRDLELLAALRERRRGRAEQGHEREQAREQPARALSAPHGGA